MCDINAFKTQLFQYLKTILDSKLLTPMYCVVFGSQIYGTKTPNSDWDIYCVVEQDSHNSSVLFDIHDTELKIDLTIRSIDLFLKDIKSGQPLSIEVLLTPEKYQLIQCDQISQIGNTINFNNPEMKKQIRHGFSEKASWSEVRARKKLKDGEVLCALKSLYHSHRILCFGIQIGTYGTIIDWEQGKEYLKELLSLDPNNLDDQYMRQSYKKWTKTGCSKCKKDSIQTQFKSVFPK